jgi:hypothetical protein
LRIAYNAYRIIKTNFLLSLIMDLMRIESDLTGGGPPVFTSPEDIKFEMETIIEALQESTGKLTQLQFGVS